MHKKKAISRLKAAIELLDASADYLRIDDMLRRRLIGQRQVLEDILAELEREE